MKKYWSQQVTKTSHALQLEKGLFTKKNPHEIASSLLQSALSSTNRKGTPYQSAMSMLNFYINRAGKKLPEQQKQILLQAKAILQEIAKNK